MSETPDTPLAVVGMACRLPGADGLDAYWSLVREGRCAIVEMPPSRLNRRLYLDPKKGARAKTYSSIAGLIDQPRGPSNPLRLTPEDLLNSDPAHLELARLAGDVVADAGWDPQTLYGARGGVYIGHTRGGPAWGDFAYAAMVGQVAPWLGEVDEFAAAAGPRSRGWVEEITRRVRSELPRRNDHGGPFLEGHRAGGIINKALGLDGPYMALDAACASSLMAMFCASRALETGAIDVAFVGGSSSVRVDSMILFSKAQSASGTGSRPFDADADGLVAAEGSVLVALKTLDRALRDGDRIRAVVRGVGASSDGRGKSLWAPREEGQIEAFRRAYGPGVDAGDLQFIEAHATSTQVGDATELSALAKVLREALPKGKRVSLGGVKANIGHTLETAGVAGFVKTVLAIQNKTIPPVINVKRLNPKIDWEASPFRLPFQAEPWPEQPGGKPRRAGVNSFGIGGCNSHVVVDEFQPATHVAASVPELPWKNLQGDDAAVAIVAMSTVVPGALNLAAFWSRLGEGHDARTEIPAERWNVGASLSADGRPKPWSTTLNLGGFLSGFKYDWRRHRIAPKQMETADPLQFLMLEAVDQALDAAGFETGAHDRKRTGVIVGTAFVDDFLVNFEVGSRLPAFGETTRVFLREQGVPQSVIETINDRFAELQQRRMPALEDDTGGFTSSSLASRITRTFDLMGGAMSVDSGAVVALSALEIGRQILLTGKCDTMIVASGQRAMGLPTYERLAMSQQLAKSATAPLDEQAEGMVPAEGAAVAVLKRLVDARRDGDPILAIVRGAAVRSGADCEAALSLALPEAMAQAGVSSQDLSAAVLSAQGNPTEERAELAAVGRVMATREAPLPVAATSGPFGTIIGASGMLSLAHAALEAQHMQTAQGLPPKSPRPEIAGAGLSLSVGNPPLVAACDDGRVYVGVNSVGNGDSAVHVVIERPEPAPDRPRRQPVPKASHPAGAPARPRGLPATGAKIVRASAASRQELLKLVADMATAPDVWIAEAGRADLEPRSSKAIGHNAAFVVDGAANLADVATKVLQTAETIDAPGTIDRLATQGAYIGQRASDEPKTAWLFPGQGSQYAGMTIDLIAASPAAAKMAAAIDEVARRHAWPTISELVESGAADLGRDVWRTQLAMLAADALWLAHLRSLLPAPACVTGHSYGEFASLLAAGSWSFETAALATAGRCLSIDERPEIVGTMLAVPAGKELAEEVCADSGQAFVANANSPAQTIIGGTVEALAAVAAKLKSRGVAARTIAVPRPFHTPLMAPAAPAFRQRLNDVAIAPCRTPVLSGVVHRYVADPVELRDQLAAQLTTPVDFVAQIERLYADGVRRFIEVGPGHVLTQLTKAILAGRPAVVIACDDKRRQGMDKLLRLQAAIETLAPAEPASASATAIAPIASNPEAPRAKTTSETAPPSKAQRPSTTVDGLRIAVLTGSPYEMGCAHGAAFRSEILRMIKLAADLAGAPNVAMPSLSEAWNRRQELFSTAELDEMEGIAAGAGVAFESVVAHNLRVYPDIDGGCVHVASASRSNDGSPLVHGANEDLPLGLIMREALTRIVQVRRPTDGFASMTFGVAGQVGGINGVNERGLVVTSTMLLNLPRKESSARGLLRAPVVSRVLSQAHDVDSAIALLQGCDASGAWSMCISHAATDDLAYVEHDGTAVRVTRRPDRVVAANHAQMLSPRTDAPKHSQQRGQRLQQLATTADPVTARSLMEWLRDKVDPRSPNASRATMSTICRVDNQLSVVFALSEAAVYVTRGPFGAGSPDEFVKLDLREFLGLDPIVVVGPAPSAPTSSPPQKLPDVAAQASGAAIVAELTPAEFVRVATPVNGRSPVDTSDRICTRFVPRVVEKPLPSSAIEAPRGGVCLVLGDNPLGQALANRLRGFGNAVTLWPSQQVDEAIASLEQTPVDHLFLTGSFDADASLEISVASWARRRRPGVLGPYALAQKWHSMAAKRGTKDHASLIACVRLGGAFGFDGVAGPAEAGALTGFVKGLAMEETMRSQDKLRCKAIDLGHGAERADFDWNAAADFALTEWRNAEAEVEIARIDGRRLCVRSVNQLVEPRANQPLVQGPQNWVVTGGARGVTAAVAMGIGRRFGGTLHLIGSSPLPTVDPAWLDLSAEQTLALRNDVVQQAIAKGEVGPGRPPASAWDRVAKAIEIAKSLRGFTEAGIKTAYHACDVGDVDQLRAVLDQIRAADGPITGVVHGAGFEKSAKLPNKKLDLVDRTFRAKIDGFIALFELTRQDPLRVLVGFGSTSGRLGSVGQTDYSAANDMLSKLAVAARRERPELNAFVVDWFAWDEVGMAARPETKHSAEFATIRFMPVVEGVDHLLTEIEAGAPEPSLMFVDWQYIQQYMPEELLQVHAAHANATQAPSTSATSPATARRAVAGMIDAPVGEPRTFVPLGPSLILGDNGAARRLAQAIKSAGGAVTLVPHGVDPKATAAAVEAALAKAWHPHLFLAQARDPAASDLQDFHAWFERRDRGIVAPALVLQAWQRAWATDSSRPATVAAMVSLGGDFGSQTAPAAPEGGAVRGLMRSLAADSSFVAKTLEFPLSQSPTTIARDTLAELASGAADAEVAFAGTRRMVPSWDAAPHASASCEPGIVPGSTWIALVDRHGTTAGVALALAKRFGLKMHLIGAAPLSSAATVHPCNLGEWMELDQVLRVVRQKDGPIAGVLHGAALADSETSRVSLADISRAELDAAIAERLTSAIAAVHLLEGDPLTHFVSLGNAAATSLPDAIGAEGVVQLTAWLRHRRPDVRTCSLRAATLDPVAIAQAIVDECVSGAPDADVRASADASHVDVSFSQQSPASPGPLMERIVARTSDVVEVRTVIDPVNDAFLAQHRFRDKPMYPTVGALETMAQAAALVCGSQQVFGARNLEVTNSLKWLTDAPRELRIDAQRLPDGTIAGRIGADFKDSKGRVLRENQEHFLASFIAYDAAPDLGRGQLLPMDPGAKIDYGNGGFMYHGPLYRILHEYGVHGPTIAIDAIAGGPEEFSPNRSGTWVSPAVVLDACFYAAGGHHWLTNGQVLAIPAGLQAVDWCRLPIAGEKLQIQATRVADVDGAPTYDGGVLDAHGNVILTFSGYRMVIVPGTGNTAA